MDENVVGHVPREFSKLAYHFINHGGIITCEVTGSRRLSELPDKGLVVPCVYTFIGKPAMIKRLLKLIIDKAVNV